MRITLAIACFLYSAPLCADVASDRQQLARECDALIARVVRRPYGWAWADAAPDPKPKAGAQVVNMRPNCTPAAAFALYWAGEQLGEPRYKEAGYQAARGLAASQRQTGMVAAHPTFLPTHAGGRDDVALVADRAPTYAAEAVLLTLIEEGGNKDDFLRTAALRSINWNLHQQPVNGSWPQSDPPTTQPSDAVRLLRLDDGDWRNCTFAMILANAVLDDSRCARSVQRSNDMLLRLRIGEPSLAARHLWATAYGMNAFPSNRLAEFQPGVDVVASRKVMETFLATVLTLGEPLAAPNDEKPTLAVALAQAATDLGKLPKYDDHWLRLYDFDVSATRPPPPRTPVGFERIATLPAPHQLADSWGIDHLLPQVAELQKNGRDALSGRLSSQRCTMRQRIAATLCNLTDEPFADPSHSAASTDSEKNSDAAARIWQLINRIRSEEH